MPKLSFRNLTVDELDIEKVLPVTRNPQREQARKRLIAMRRGNALDLLKQLERMSENDNHFKPVPANDAHKPVKNSSILMLECDFCNCQDV